MTREEYNKNPNICLNCKQPILCLDGDILTNIRRKKFCNHSCAAIYNNQQREKRGYYCKNCGTLIGYGYKEFYQKKYCDKCNSNYINWNEITYGEIKSKRAYQINSRIRELARNEYFKNHPEPKCEICGYNKHIEIHHIKGISTFSDDTPITVINDLTNLIGLCPNHHWEMENNMLNI